MELLQALRIVINYLDKMMQEKPSRELVDVSNYLEELHAKVKEEEL